MMFDNIVAFVGFGGYNHHVVQLWCREDASIGIDAFARWFMTLPRAEISGDQQGRDSSLHRNAFFLLEMMGCRRSISERGN